MKNELIGVQQGFDIIAAQPLDFGAELLPLSDCLGRINFEALICDRDQPPFNRVMMDGIAIRYQDFENGQREWILGGVQAAGAPIYEVPIEIQAIEIMTGAALPMGLDTVIPYERIEIRHGYARVIIDELVLGQHIHKIGSDAKKGVIALTKGIRIGPADIGIAASLGYSRLNVQKQPRVIVVSTGDELVDIDQEPLPHQIRRSNVYALAAAVKRAIGSPAKTMHILDDLDKTVDVLKKSAEEFDVVILSGAVSMGKFDCIPSALKEIGAEILFHGIAQKPGKPMLFGRYKHAYIFALPGNPISTLVCWARYVRPFLTGQELIQVKHDGAFVNTSALTHFTPAVAFNRMGEKVAKPIPFNGSGDYLALAGATGFVECAKNEMGLILPYWPI